MIPHDPSEPIPREETMPQRRSITMEEQISSMRDFLGSIVSSMDGADGRIDNVIHQADAIRFLQDIDPNHPLISIVRAKGGDFFVDPRAVFAEGERLARTIDRNNNNVIDANEVLTDALVTRAMTNLIRSAQVLER